MASPTALLADAAAQFWREATGSFSPIRGMFEANVWATALCFFFSLVHQNSSIYDPYWSMAPVANALYFAAFDRDGLAGIASDPRKALLVGLITLYGARLTISWWRRLGKDMVFGDAMVRDKHEDWRYVEIAAKPGLGSWVNWIIWWGFSSPILIHLYPTLCTALGSVPMYYALSGAGGGAARAPFGVIDIVAAAVLLTGTVLEMVADLQMDAYLRTDAARRKEVCRTGLWAISRHPNYLGEQMVWLGVWLFAFSARGVAALPSIVGFGNIVILFATASIPWLERRQRERRPAYAQYQKEVACLIPYVL